MLPLIKAMYKQYPNMVEAVRVRHIHYNKTIEYIREKELKGDLFVIRPPKALEIGSMEHNPDELRRVYEIGIKTMESKLEDLKKYLN